MDYFSGFGNHFESEAEAGTLPQGQNSPKVPVKGLVPEQISGSAFTRDRHQNLRTWLYRIHPSTFHGAYEKFQQSTWISALADAQTPPSQFRWQPLEPPSSNCDFVEGVRTMVSTNNSAGAMVHHYYLNKPMGDRYFYNADGDVLLVPEKGELEIRTELGVMKVEPQEIAMVPRGMKFQVNPKSSGWCRGYMGENTGHPFVLPNLGPLGANGLANPRDFLTPSAAYEIKRSSQIVGKFSHNFWSYEQNHSPLDVVAWHGNYVPFKYDLRRFNTMGTVSYDHPDPSIYTVLTSPSVTPGVANLDFVIFPPRWLVGENTFRPPYYHRNIMSEYMGLIDGAYDAKQGGFVPGGASLHNCMSAHGPDTATFENAIESSEAPKKIENTMAFMFESCHIFHPTHFALNTPALEKGYAQCWQNFKPMFKGN